MKKLFKRTTAFLMALIISVPVNVQAVGTSSGVSGNSETPIEVHLEWEDSTYKNGTAYNLKAYDSRTSAVKMKVSYSSSKIREEGYKAGELIFTVKGIGNVLRDGILEAVVGADKSETYFKTRDWTYTWNSTNDTYTLVNNEDIKPNSVFSGYFELVWGIDARDSVHGYSQSDIQAELFLPEGGSVKSEILSFTNETKADTFSVYIEEGEMYSYAGLTGGISNPEDYAFIKYNLGTTDWYKSRGLDDSYFLFNPDYRGIGSGAVVISPKLSAMAVGDGTYRVSIYNNVLMANQYLYVAYPLSSYGDQTVSASIEKYGSYYEGDDSGNTSVHQLAIDIVDVPIPNDFHFSDIPGDTYNFIKDTWYDKYVSEESTESKGGDIRGSLMVEGTSETFYLEGLLNCGSGSKYTLEMVDDFLYIVQNNGNYRQLGVGEYEFSKVYIPSVSNLINSNNMPLEKDKYPVRIYAVGSGGPIEAGNLVFEGYLNNIEQLVDLPEGTTAIKIVFADLEESIRQFSIPVTVKFHINDTSELEEQLQDNLSGGHVVNTSFIKLYDGSGNWMNNNFTADNYIDDTNLGLAQKDIDVYGSYLDREKDSISFFLGDKNDYEAYTSIDSIDMVDGKFNIGFTMGGKLDFAEEYYPNQFSLYTILPEGLTLKGYRTVEDIWGILKLEGLGLSDDVLVNACTPEVIENYKNSGRTYIALHFDFGGYNVSQHGEIYANLVLKADKAFFKKNNSLQVRSAIIIDEDVPVYIRGKVQDIGSWGEEGSSELYSDIDRDGNTEELLASFYDYEIYLYADSSQFQILKYVRTSYSDGWVQLPEVPYEEYGGLYKYKLSLINGNSRATGIVVRDVLENGTNSEWKGSYLGVDLSECEKIGMTGVVSEDMGSDGKVRSVSIDFGNSVLKEGQELPIIINMRAPTDGSLKNKITENGFSASFTSSDSATGNVTQFDNLNSNLVQVRLTPSLKTLIILKKDEVDGSRLSGAVFSLISRTSGEVVRTVETNLKGLGVMHDIPSDDSYILREITAPKGYDKMPDVDVEIDSNVNVQYINCNNSRSRGTIQLHKVNNLDEDIDVSGAEYTLYNADDVVVGTAITDINGIAEFSGVVWGTYKIKETASPEGYILNAKVYPVVIGKDNVSEVIRVEAEDKQSEATVHLQKYVSGVSGTETSEALSGATFELIRKTRTGDKRIGLYVTDGSGCIDIGGLAYGEYYFREYRAPMGYNKSENKDFTLSPNSRNASVTVYDSRKPGSILVIKKDNLGNLIKGAEFELYDEAKENLLGTYTTDEYGNILVEGLEWGTYYLKETKAPGGYHVDLEWKKAVISGSNLSVSIECINETKKGSVVLTKVSALDNNNIVLQGAEYSLYSSEGSLIGVYTTDANGQIVVEGLEWGSYYFIETVAPVGYSLSSEKVRFSVNSINGGMTQFLVAEDGVDEKSITVTKRIKADEIIFDHGNPTFIFKLNGVDVNSIEHTYHRIVVFDKAYVAAHEDSEGYVSQSVVFSGLVAGEYRCTEEDTSRYRLEGISDIVNGVASGEYVDFDVITNDSASAVFTNRKYENQDYSDNQSITNILKDKRKLTGLKAVYGMAQVEAESTVNRGILEVVALYDDGTSEVLSDSAYSLSIDEFPNNNGVYTVEVSYTENGITRKGSFTVTIYGMKKRITSLEASVAGDSNVYVGTDITPEMFNVFALYNDGDRVKLSSGSEVVTSPNYPNNYPSNMSEDTNYWERKFNGADSIVVTFDSSSYLEGTNCDWVQVYDSTETSVSDKLGGTSIAGTVVTVTGDYVKIAMRSNNSTQYKGFLATLVPYKNGVAMGPEYFVDPTTVPNKGGELGVTVSLNTERFPEEKAVSTVVNMTAGYPEPLLEYGKAFNSHVPSDIEYVVFTDTVAPSDATLIDVSDKGNMSVVSWVEGSTMYVSSQRGGVKVIAKAGNSEMFYNKTNLKGVDFSMLDTSNVTDMSQLFYGCTSLVSVDLSDLNLSSNKNMYRMFGQCRSLQSIDFGESFDSSSVTNMSNVFENCSALQSLDLSSLDMSSVTSVTELFSGCTNLESIIFKSGTSTSNLKNTSYMFYNCKKLLSVDLSSFSTGQVTEMTKMFYNCNALTGITFGENFITSEVTSMSGMFEGCYALSDLDLSGFDTSKVRNMSDMFSNCRSLVSLTMGENFDTSNVSIMSSMFDNCRVLPSLDLGGKFDTSNVVNMGFMFNNCYKLATIIFGDRFNTSKVTTMGSMFSNCNSLTSLDLSGFNTSQVTNMASMFQSCWNLQSLDLSSFDTTKVTSMSMMFLEASGLRELDLSNFYTPNLNGVSMMFNGCRSLSKIIFSDKFITTNVTSMSSMFSSCNSLVSLDLSGFDTSNVTSMSDMFNICGSLQSITFGSGFSTAGVTNMSRMFAYCKVLGEVDLSSFDMSSVEKVQEMFDNCFNISTTLSITNSNTTNYSNMFRNAATSLGSGITVNYTTATSDLVDLLITTKSSGSNVVKGVSVD